MRPLSLYLKGFRGVLDGLGREEIALDFEALAGDAALIALAGRNGRGKTTLLDNMQPFPVMPSRAGDDGLGAFSYYDHVCLPENVKDLVWEYDGRRFRTQMLFYLNGRKRTEAYLHEQVAGRWVPVRLADGTVADGKVDSYLRCVRSLVGSQETFFTSAFAAQGRRQLSSYRNAQIKQLLADLLNLEDIRVLGTKATDVVKLLRVGLTTLRQSRERALASLDELARSTARRPDVAAAAEGARRERTEASGARDAARDAVATLEADARLSVQVEAQRDRWRQERQRIIESGRRALVEIDGQQQCFSEQLGHLEQRVGQRRSDLRARRTELQRQRGKLAAALAQAAAVERATRRLPLAHAVLESRGRALTAASADLREYQGLTARACQLGERIAAVEREAGQVSLKHGELMRRYGLVHHVPCQGSGLTECCPLLGDARAAQALLPTAQQELDALGGSRATLRGDLAALEQRIEALRDQRCEERATRARQRVERCQSRLRRLEIVAARGDGLALLRGQFGETELQLPKLADAAIDADDADEVAARQHLLSQLARCASHRAETASRHRAELDAVDASLAALPASPDAQPLIAARMQLQQAEQALVRAEAAQLEAIRQEQALDAALRRHATLQTELARMTARQLRVEQTMADWSLFARCMSNDGLIALCIDDAGPAISALANELLRACHGPRFSVSLRTQLETGKGEAREGFDIVVHDAEPGQSKSVALLSPGQRVWINECLTRAVALYLTGHSGRRYVTLFSDEADGPLDPEMKRMFMAMKREVLRIGGYRQEYFVSQTPELTAMADVVIDLDRMAASDGQGGRER